MHFHTFVIKNVMRRRVRSSLTVIGMAVAVGAVVALVGISRGLENSFFAIYEHNSIGLIVEQKGVKQRLTSALDASWGPKIAAIPGVKQVNSGLVDYTSLEDAGIVGVLVQGWEPDSKLMANLKIFEGGRALTAVDKNGVLLGERLAKNLGKKVGDTVNLFDDVPYQVIGIIDSPNFLEKESMVVQLADLQGFMKRPGQVTGFTVVIEHPEDAAEAERIRGEIMALSKTLDVTPSAELVNKTPEILIIRAMAWITSVIALVIGTVGMLNTMVMSVFERTREFGILRAIGWGRWRVVRMILMESMLLSLAGGVVGTAGALLLTRFLSTQRSVSGLIVTHVSPDVIVQGFLIAFFVGLLGAAYPAYRGAQLMPTEALRHE